MTSLWPMITCCFSLSWHTISHITKSTVKLWTHGAAESQKDKQLLIPAPSTPQRHCSLYLSSFYLREASQGGDTNYGRERKPLSWDFIGWVAVCLYFPSEFPVYLRFSLITSYGVDEVVYLCSAGRSSILTWSLEKCAFIEDEASCN